MKNYLTLLLAILILCSCKQNSSEKLARKHISEIEKQIKADSTNGEDFASFFEQFRCDTLFQQERICIPFEKLMTCEDSGYGSISDSTVLFTDRKEWVFYSFLLSDGTQYPFQNVTMKHDTTLIFLSDNKSPDNASKKIHTGFIRDKSKWTCISLEYWYVK